MKGQGFVEGHKILTLTLTLLTLTLDPWGFDQPLHITKYYGGGICPELQGRDIPLEKRDDGSVP